jgi:WD40 repeat protein
VWDIETQKPLTQPLELGDDAHFVTFNSDGTNIATAGKFAQVWDSRTGRSLTPRLRHDEQISAVEFSTDGYRATTRTTSGKGFIWDLAPDERPAADLRTIAELMSGSRIENAGGVVALSADELMQRWDALRTKYPEEFTVTQAQTRAWRQREIRDCMREGNLDAAQFHYWAAVLDAAQAGR